MSADPNPFLDPVIQIPSTLEITAITKAFPMVVTVSVNSETASNDYIPNQRVKLVIPYGYGMQQANGLIATIQEISGSDITLDVDSRNFDTFSEPASGPKPASLAPYGSRNLSFNNTTRKLAFQSLNNDGN